MNILLIATNRADRYMDRMVVRPVPVGLAYLAASIDEERHSLRVLDLMFSDDPLTDVSAAVSEFKPDVVGLSMRNLDNQSYFNPVSRLPDVKNVVDRIRSSSNATVVCGGPAFSILPSECFEFVGADLGVAGDGADAFATLVDHLEQGDDYKSIPGVVYRENEAVVVTEGRFTSNFNRPPRLDLLDMPRYNGSGFGVGVITKLAQAYYQTTDSTKFSGQDWRIRPTEEVVEEIRNLNTDFGIQKVFLIDSGFNIPMSSAKELCRAIVSSGLKVRWNAYLRPGECDSELTGLMKESGCSLALLAEGRDESDAASRLRQVGELANLCREVELPYTLNISFGEPGETENSVQQKIDFLEDTAPAFATIRVGSRVLPNTYLAQTALKEGLIESQSDLLMPTFYVAPEVRDWIADRLREESEKHPRWHLS
ncbi:MAG: cobalamin-dependent protein [SAR202 cluster bacterium]|nr:cobalamin-dependent protein [SAR202 cluster bacterium]